MMPALSGLLVAPYKFTLSCMAFGLSSMGRSMLKNSPA